MWFRWNVHFVTLERKCGRNCWKFGPQFLRGILSKSQRNGEQFLWKTFYNISPAFIFSFQQSSARESLVFEIKVKTTDSRKWKEKHSNIMRNVGRCVCAVAVEMWSEEMKKKICSISVQSIFSRCLVLRDPTVLCFGHFSAARLNFAIAHDHFSTALVSR